MQLVAMIVCIMLDGILLYMGYGVRGIAYGTVCCYAIYGFGYLGVAVYLARGKWLEILWFLVHLFTLFGVMVIALNITALFWPDVSSHWADQVYSSVMRLCIIIGMLLPAVWLVNRKSGMLSVIWVEFKSWRVRGSKLL